MKHMHFDLLGGASGDMILAALIAAGADVEKINQALATLHVEPVHVHVDPKESGALHGMQVHVHTHEHHEPHTHSPAESGHSHEHEFHAPHRSIGDIEQIIGGSQLPDPVKMLVMAVFTRLGQAEAKIHGTTIDQIHFHEVGAMDSIADIVGCCLGLHLLGVTGVSCSALPYGHGEIRCAHGIYPNPAPATVEVAIGLPTVSVDEPFELVTPTGAALLATWRTHETPPNGARIAGAGYGIGHRVLNNRPNVLRATLYDFEPEASTPPACLVLESNLDDTTPELIGALTERLLEDGALDVFTTAVQMKKQRPGTLLTVLCRQADKEKMLDRIFAESTTFGVREYTVQRTVLERDRRAVQTPYGKVRIKRGRRNGQVVTQSPEMDDCLRLAKQLGVSARTVWDEARKQCI